MSSALAEQDRTVLGDRLDVALHMLHRQEGQQQAVEQQIRTWEAELQSTREDLAAYGKVLAIFHSMTSTVHEKFLEAIERLVSSGLTAVFGEEIPFRILPTVRGKNVNLDFVLSGDGGENTDLLSARGGGVVSVVGVLLRIVTVRLLGDRVRQVIFLDEPLSHLSDEFVEPMGQLLAKLATDLGIQIIMVTHQDGFSGFADTVYRAQRSRNGTGFVRG